LIDSVCERVLDSMNPGVWYGVDELGINESRIAILLTNGYIRKLFSSHVYTRTDKTIQLTCF